MHRFANGNFFIGPLCSFYRTYILLVLVKTTVNRNVSMKMRHFFETITVDLGHKKWVY